MLCTLGGKTCGACCYGAAVSREGLRPRLRRHRALFPRAGSVSPLALLWHELRARRGLDLLLGPLLRLPLIGRKLRARLRDRGVCAFLAFRDDSETTVGCLLHPARWDGVDRRKAAFSLLAGIACGARDYLCASARRFEIADPRERASFEAAVRQSDWFDFGRAVSRFRLRGDPSCR